MSEIISRRDAKKGNLKRYFTGEPCLNGHISERNTGNGRCFECRAIAEKDRRKKELSTFTKFRAKGQYIKRKYGITLEEFFALLTAQNMKCAICKTETEKLVLDHCHTRNELRALLCASCNSLLGFAKDDPKILASAIQYLIEHQK